jgi:LemA protein
VGTAIALAIVVVPVVWIVWIYNGLVTQRNRFRNAFAQIDVQLRRRYDLIPNLVEAARSYLAHERQTLEAVIAARDAAASMLRAAAASPGDAGVLSGLASAERALGATLARFNAVAEAYPDLKADATIASLTEEITSTENRVAFARQAFNDQVMEYNNWRGVFPNVLVASFLGHGCDAALLEFEDRSALQAPPRVSFG